MSAHIPFPKAGWLGSKIKPWIIGKYVRKGAKKLPSPQKMQELRDRFAKPKKAA